MLGEMRVVRQASGHLMTGHCPVDDRLHLRRAVRERNDLEVGSAFYQAFEVVAKRGLYGHSSSGRHVSMPNGQQRLPLVVVQGGDAGRRDKSRPTLRSTTTPGAPPAATSASTRMWVRRQLVADRAWSSASVSNSVRRGAGDRTGCYGEAVPSNIQLCFHDDAGENTPTAVRAVCLENSAVQGAMERYACVRLVVIPDGSAS